MPVPKNSLKIFRGLIPVKTDCTGSYAVHALAVGLACATITTDMDDVTQHFAIINTSGPTGRWEQVLEALVS